jgi:CHASE3 domain sensor protein
MSHFHNLRIQPKLLLAFGFTVALIAGALVFALLRLQSAIGEFENNAGGSASAAVHASQLRSAFQFQHQQLKDYLLRGANPDNRAKYLKAFQDAAGPVAAKRKQLGEDLSALGTDPSLADATGNQTPASSLLATFDSEYKTYNAAVADLQAKVGQTFDQAAGDAVSPARTGTRRRPSPPCPSGLGGVRFRGASWTADATVRRASSCGPGITAPACKRPEKPSLVFSPAAAMSRRPTPWTLNTPFFATDSSQAAWRSSQVVVAAWAVP